MQITFSTPKLPRTGTIAVGVLEGKKLTPTAAALDRRTGGAVAKALSASRFTGKVGEILPILSPTGLAVRRVVLYGMGKAGEVDDLRMQAAGGHIVAHLAGTGESAAAVAVDAVKGAKAKPAAMAANLGYGASLRSYRFARYRTREKRQEKPSLRSLTVMVRDPLPARKAYAVLDKVADGVFFTRDLVSEPANVLYPETLAQQARSLTKLGVKVEILDEKKLRRLGMGALLGVAQGSVRPPRVVVMQWTGARKARNKRPVAFVGKGVTFDTGGISIKPSEGMHDMKWDMAGAGVVMGLMKALARRKAKVNAVGVVGLVENMPSGSAQRPGDIVTSMSGQTIEVLNTDAEGRLVLADALWYCQNRFKPRAMVDLATLTGAIIVALGSEYAGLFANNDKLAEGLVAAGKATGEKVWRLPLAEAYDKLVNCDVADMKNITGVRGAGSITAAQFLQRFVNKVPWAHLDIAGVAWGKKDAPTVPKGGTGFGVRLLDRFVHDNYEER
jgi:leucyl aminopeptidase